MHSKFLKVFEFISILKLFPFMFTPKKLFKLPFKNTIIFDAAVPSFFFLLSKTALFLYFLRVLSWSLVGSASNLHPGQQCARTNKVLSSVCEGLNVAGHSALNVSSF